MKGSPEALPVNLQSELNVPRRESTGDLTKTGISKSCVRCVKVGVVKGIEHLCSKLNFYPLLPIPPLLDSQIPGVKTGCAQIGHIPRHISKSIGCGLRKGVDIKPSVDGGTGDMGVAAKVRTLETA